MQTYRSIFIRVGAIIWFLTTIFGSPSCKKADHYAQLINAQPFLVTTPTYGIAIPYQTTYLVGDTATFFGRFFVGQPGSAIQVGNVSPTIVSQTKLTLGANNAYTHQPDSLDVIKFVITAAMGIGSSIPVYITAHGITITGPPLTIQKFQGVQQKTDTTLFVDSLAGFIPADVNLYQNNSLPLVQNMNVSGNGILCFNNLTGMYLVNHSQVTPLLRAGSQLLENGVPYTVQLFLGAAITFGGDSVYFSAQVIENIPDTATAYIFRLCKLDIAAGTVTTVNRTEVQKGIAAANEQPGPFEGALGSLKVVAANLKMDANGALYFVNYYSPARVDHDNTATWYAGDGINMGIPDFNSDVDIYNNICRMDGTGKVKSLFYQNPAAIGNIGPYTIPGYPIVFACDYLVSLDGNDAIINDNFNTNIGLASVAYFSLQQGILLRSESIITPGNMRFYTYDTSSVTDYAQGVSQSSAPSPSYIPFNFVYPNNGNLAAFMLNNLLLPGGYMLYPSGISLLAANLQNNAAYCYAGTEAGLLASPYGNYPGPAVQNQTTGRAKYVSFSASGPVYFADGGDKSNGIYYYTGWMDYVNGLHFYKLYPKK